MLLLLTSVDGQLSGLSGLQARSAEERPGQGAVSESGAVGPLDREHGGQDGMGSVASCGAGFEPC